MKSANEGVNEKQEEHEPRRQQEEQRQKSHYEKMKVMKSLCLLEERLVQHDDNRKEVQGKLQEIYTKSLEETELAEERITVEIRKNFDTKEERILSLIKMLSSKPKSPDPGDQDLDNLIKQAEQELSVEQQYEIEAVDNPAEPYKFRVLEVHADRDTNMSSDKEDDISNKIDLIITQLKEHLDKIYDSMTAAQDRLIVLCTEKCSRAEELTKEINEKLEPYFSQEDARIQKVVCKLRKKLGSSSPDELERLTLKAKVALVTNQRYAIVQEQKCDSYELLVTKEISLKYIDFDKRKPQIQLRYSHAKEKTFLSFTFLSDRERELLKPLGITFNVNVEMWKKGFNESNPKRYLREYVLGDSKPICFDGIFAPSTKYGLRIRIEYGDSCTEWSDVTEITTPEFNACCIWKDCPTTIDEKMRYSVDPDNSRVATNIEGNYCCAITGNVILPPNKVTSWNIRIIHSKRNDGNSILVGVAPSTINQNVWNNYERCGWYLGCYSAVLWSGPPHNYRGNTEYGPRKRDGEYVHTGDTVGVVMDTRNGDLSFVLNGASYGVAFYGVPLDKPIVLCTLLYCGGDSVELDTSEVKEVA